MALSDWELWAGRAPVVVAVRIGECAREGDSAGVETWTAIAARVDQLMDYRQGRPLSQQ